MAGSLRQKAPKGSRSSATTQNDRISDPRFTNIQTDPRFRLPSKRNTHVQIDKRFERMLRDDSFSSRAKVDRYGRRLPKDVGKKELEKYYRIEDDEGISKQDAQIAAELAQTNAEVLEDVSSSAEESSSEESVSEESEEEEVFGLLEDQGAEGGEVSMGEVTSRIAVVNLDWDNIRAADLMAVFTSFLSNAGQIKKVSIYPSEFGKERIQREEMDGPPKEIFTQKNASKATDATHPESKDEDEDLSAEEDDEKIKQSLIQEDTNQ
ncbi:MAG: hypothetical protein Q9174_002345, partial [Haloplaca sp. 1 TL-2023]